MNPIPIYPDISRPIDNTEWMSDVRDFVAERFPSVTLFDANPAVRLLKTSELEDFRPKYGTKKDIETQIRQAIPSSERQIDGISNNGVSYLKKFRDARYGTLLIKFASDPRLVEENEKLLNMLATHNVRPKGGIMYFSAIIGQVGLRWLDGSSKQQLRYGLTDRVPDHLNLAPITVNWRTKSKTPR